jgi:type IV pilus assembly protein PilE
MELMTVVVVLGILASIAVPSYRRYLIRSQRTDGTAALLQIQAAEEKYYLQYNNYTADLTTSITATPPGLGISGTSRQGLYGLSVALATGGQSYTATAAPVSGKGQQDDTACQSLTLTDAGARNATGTGDHASCWK